MSIKPFILYYCEFVCFSAHLPNFFEPGMFFTSNCTQDTLNTVSQCQTTETQLGRKYQKHFYESGARKQLVQYYGGLEHSVSPGFKIKTLLFVQCHQSLRSLYPHHSEKVNTDSPAATKKKNVTIVTGMSRRNIPDLYSPFISVRRTCVLL